MTCFRCWRWSVCCVL